MKKSKLGIAFALAGMLGMMAPAYGEEWILKFKGLPTDFEVWRQARAAEGLELTLKRTMSNGAYVIEADVDAGEALGAREEVKYIQENRRLRPHVTPNDPDYSLQWYLYDSYGVHADEAWDLQQGGTDQVVAVVDTGVLYDHPELSGRILAGYDFVSDVDAANDGDGRDADATDPGDGVSFSECGPGEDAAESSWHGTLVSGIIAANSDNGVGIAGLNWQGKVLPVRALGKCGGLLSDILDGMRWAAGLSVSGVPSNPYPAQVVNLSLGVDGACEPAEQDVIDELKEKGVLVVVAAGNDGEDLDRHPATPASCDSVITVAATSRSGILASYSNYGSTVAVSAPGGSTFNPIWTTSYVDGAYDYEGVRGTSFSAPITSGVLSLALAHRSDLTYDDVVGVLEQSSDLDSVFCPSPNDCGAGLLNARALLEAVDAINKAPVFVSFQEEVSGVEGEVLTVTVATAEDPEGAALTYTAQGLPDGAALSATSGELTWASPVVGEYEVTILVSDGVNEISQDMILTIAEPPSSGGGGCTVSRRGDGDALLALLLPLLWVWRRMMPR